MYHIYVLQSLKDGNLYIGCTGNLVRRLEQHRRGKVRSTKGRLPVKLVYSEGHGDIYEAFKMERFYKTSKGKKELKEKIHCQIV